MIEISRMKWADLVVTKQVHEFQAGAFHPDCKFLVAMLLYLVPNIYNIPSLKYFHLGDRARKQLPSIH